MTITKRFLLIALTLLLSSPAFAVQPNERLSDPALETRARSISSGLRCLVCQNQSIDDSDAELAHDFRLIVRQRLLAGDSDKAVQQYLVDRYGDYILLQPPLKTATLLLWLGPAIFLLIAGAGLWRSYKRYTIQNPLPPLSEAEKQELAKLMNEDKQQ